MIDPQLYDRVREQIARTGFTPEVQTKIALLMTAAKSGNLAFLSGMQGGFNLDVAHQFMLSQYVRELEAVTLLNRTTSWSGDPALGLRGSQIVAPLAMAWGGVMMPPGPMLNSQAAYRGIALGHAQFARIRLAPVVPADVDPLHPFVVALNRIEQENGRMLQTQIRLLKNVGTDVPIETREALIDADQKLVDGVFSDFLGWLAAD